MTVTRAQVIVLTGIVLFLSSSISTLAAAGAVDVRDDGTALVTGRVVGHNDGCEADGVCSLSVDADGQNITLIYAEGDIECANTQAVSWVKWGQNVRIGTVIEAYGSYSNQGSVTSLRFCASMNYYIRTVAPPA